MNGHTHNRPDSLDAEVEAMREDNRRRLAERELEGDIVRDEERDRARREEEEQLGQEENERYRRKERERERQREHEAEMERRTQPSLWSPPMAEKLEDMKQLVECEGTENANCYLRAGWKLLSINHHRGTLPHYIFGWARDEPAKQPEGLIDHAKSLQEFIAKHSRRDTQVVQ